MGVTFLFTWPLRILDKTQKMLPMFIFPEAKLLSKILPRYEPWPGVPPAKS